MIVRDLHRLRSYQLASWGARQRGYKRFVERIHRRAGKDRGWMGILALEALQHKGTYLHYLQTLGEARRAIWDNIVTDKYDGIEHAYKMIDAAFPPEIRAKKPNETEMQIEFVNGSIYQLMGAESLDAINRGRGPNPIGIILSEYAFMDYDPWPILSPILAENGGWVAFISTPNIEGDRFDRLYNAVLGDPNWFVQSLTVDDTRRDAIGESGGPVISKEEIEAMRISGITEEEIQREYYCNIKGYLHGTIYGDVITRAEQGKRVGKFPYIPQLPVGVCLDLGHSDIMSAWFYQLYNNGVFFIDYWEDTQKDIKDVAHLMREDRKYSYGRVVLPWDGRAAANYMEEVKFSNVEVCKRNRMRSTGDEPVSVQEQINEIRLQFPKFYFDDTIRDKKNGGGVGLDHLKKYSRDRDKEKNVFIKEPRHDEHSHAADALRTGVAGGFDPLEFPGSVWQSPEIKVERDFDLEKF